jgi:acyl-CoA-binding protein
MRPWLIPRFHPVGGATRVAAKPRALRYRPEDMTLIESFEDAQARVKRLKAAPSNDELLELYALFKQATVGEVSGSRPGMMDFKGRAKFDAWSKKKGQSKDASMTSYVALVDRLTSK